MTSILKDGKIILSGVKLKALRRAKGLSQEALTQACVRQSLSISIASIKRAEVGRAVNYRTARQIAIFHDVDLNDLCLLGGLKD